MQGRPADTNFNPLRPRGRRHDPIYADEEVAVISTHSARGGGDPWAARPWPTAWTFQPTPPAGAETLQGAFSALHAVIFQPTPPAGAETRGDTRPNSRHSDFNPLRPRGRRPPQRPAGGPPVHISTHSARGGGDASLSRAGDGRVDISTHSARGGGDLSRPPSPPCNRRYFNPLRPRGRRLKTKTSEAWENVFQPTPPAGAETLSGP